MIPAAHKLRNGYHRLKIPVVVVVGAEGRFIESEQSSKLHREISDSVLRSIPATGHMLHQTATGEILSAIDTRSRSVPPSDNERR
jgi:pimeloyl-ACP methyl ester carboxylesterase